MGFYGHDVIAATKEANEKMLNPNAEVNTESTENIGEIMESCFIALENFNNLVTTVEFCTENSNEFVLEFSMDTVKTKIKEIWDKVKKFAATIFAKIKAAVKAAKDKVKKIFTSSKDTINKAKKVDEANKGKESAKNEAFEFLFEEAEEDSDGGNSFTGKFNYYYWANGGNDPKCGKLSESWFVKNVEKIIDAIDKAYKDFGKIDPENVTLIKAKYVDLMTGSDSEINKAIDDIDHIFPSSNNYGNSLYCSKGRSLAEYGEDLAKYEVLMSDDIDTLNEAIKKLEAAKADPIGININTDNNEVLGLIAKVNSSSANAYGKAIKSVQATLSQVMSFYNKIAKEQVAYKEKVEAEYAKIA